MNLLIENENSALLNKIDANVIKTLNGEYTKDKLTSELGNLYYSKVIIDITAIKDYENFDALFDFLNYFEKDQIILLLDEKTPKECVSKLVQEGYYDFTKNVGGINYLMEHPNTLKDVEKYILENQFQNILNKQEESVLEDNKKTDDSFQKNENQIIIGLENLTPHAGATTLMYLLTKGLSSKYQVQGIEMINQDHIYLRDVDISGCTSYEDLKQKIKSFQKKEVIIIDLNGINGDAICDMVLYLIEPGIVSLNKLLNSQKNLNRIFKEEKIILNRSSIDSKDIPSFEYETGIKVFYNLENLDDREERIKKINELLIKLGFNKIAQSGGLFSLFK